jgi:spore coat protein A, manganese oxidase
MISSRRRLRAAVVCGALAWCAPDSNRAAYAGACCLAGEPGSCQARTEDECAAQSGRFLGASTTCGVDLCPFVDALPLLPVAQPTLGTPGGAASYDMAAVEVRRQLHRDLPPTTLWTYNGNYPGATIEARTGQPVEVTWINDLRDADGAPRSEHILPADRCLHGTHEAGNTARIVTHLHGGHVPAASDGYPEDTLLPGQRAVYPYPNQQLPATLWYHDHALGLTRLNVYMGLAGFYLLRDDVEEGLGLPAGAYEIPLLIQDRSFRGDGELDYPTSWLPHFFGDRILVNGKVWPYLEVARSKYRFRILNGANARTLRLALSNGATFRQIGTDGGLLPAPVPVSQVILAPAERADVVIDFADYPAGTVLRLVNDAPAPFPGRPGVGVVPDVLEFRVQPQPGHTAPLPSTLRPLAVLNPQAAVRTRTFELQQFYDPCAGSVWMINGLEWDQITEWPVLGTSEIWSFLNFSGMAHPMHIHLVMFQVLDRQRFEVVDGKIVPLGERLPPPPAEAGWKDTVNVAPYEITRVISRFTDYAGRFPYHCHVLEHEDHDMMRQFQTVASGPDACLGDGDTLCIDDHAGDHRFKIQARYETAQAGGWSGKAHAVPLAEKGVTNGGLFWFFSPTNPELLVKVLDGCAINGHYWVYASAATNVGLNVTVTDTVTGRQFVRTNSDLTAAPPFQSTDALPCE